MSELKPPPRLTRGQKVGGSIAVAGALLAAVTPTVFDFLGKWEGKEELTVYADKLANGLPTVCKGLTKHVTSTPIIVGERWTKEKCEQEERQAILKVQLELARCFKLTPAQSVFDAATSHAWNFGSGKTCSSKAMEAWNQGNWDLGCQRLSRGDDGRPAWSYASGVFVKGLANRRADETKLCLKD